MLEQFDEIEVRLTRIKENFAKSVNRTHTEAHWNGKSVELEDLKERFLDANTKYTDQLNAEEETLAAEATARITVLLDFLVQWIAENRERDAKRTQVGVSGAAESVPVVAMASNIPLQSVEGAVGTFDGENVPVASWFSCFESTATMCQWSGAQKYVFCRQLLAGAARLAASCKVTVVDYATLKAFLTERRRNAAQMSTTP